VAAAPSDSITIPDGTPLTLRLTSELSSVKARVGDALESAAIQLRINGIIVVPADSKISGVVVQVDHPHRRLKNGLVRIRFDKVVLPGGESASLRASKSPAGKPEKMKGEPQPQTGSKGIVDGIGEGLAGVALFSGVGIPALAPLSLLIKGDEQVFPAGTLVTVYINGPLKLDRAALIKQQPPPYKGPAQIFVNHTSGRPYLTRVTKYPALYCSDVQIGSLWFPMRIELNSGTYSLSLHTERHEYFDKEIKPERRNVANAERASKPRAKTVQLSVQDDHQYWIEWDRGGLHVMDPQAYPTEFDIVRGEFHWTDVDLQNGCPLVEPSAPASARPGRTR
jgi:hypothetical protein